MEFYEHFGISAVSYFAKCKTSKESVQGPGYPMIPDEWK